MELEKHCNIYSPPPSMPILRAKRVMYFEDSVSEFILKDGLLIVLTTAKDLLVYAE